MADQNDARSPGEAKAGTDVVVIGAGPAGLTAAHVLSERGMRVVVVDESPVVGGQIGRRRFDKPFDPNGLPWTRPYRRLLGRDMRQAAIEWRLSATVWAVSASEPAAERTDSSGPRFTVHTATAGRITGSVECRWLLIATGAYDAPLIVNGWTVPGVVGMGALQTLLKSDGLPASDRVVIHGTHPLTLIAAAEAVNRGVRPVAVSLGQPVVEAARDVSRLWRAPWAATRKSGQLLKALWLLARARVPVRFGVTIEAVEGTTRVTRVRVTRRARGGPAAAEIVECDVVALGGGFLASTELARGLGCAATWSGDEGGWVIDHDAGMESSVPGVFVAGEVCGVAGAEAAAAEGFIAAHSIADHHGPAGHALGRPGAFTRARARFRVRRWRRFGRLTARMGSRARGEALRTAARETIMCRCEGVTIESVQDSLERYPGLVTARDVKLVTRLGMGPCQGRYCGPLLAAWTQARGGDIGRLGTLAPRVPVKPLRLDQRHPSSDQLRKEHR